MNDHESQFQTILQTPNRRECVDSSFILEAVGITFQMECSGGVWTLAVPAVDATKARDELHTFAAENVSTNRPLRTRITIYSGSWIAVLGYCCVMLCVAFLKHVGSYGMDWLDIGRMHAGSVFSGQWFRCLTALTLHADTGHLFSNIAFGGIFGLFAGRVLGGGVAWFAIVIAGAMGNASNAALRAPEHSSIGASTAVFAALGMLVAHALHPRENREEKTFKRWSPLIAGVVLLGLTGVGGPRTDVLAHVTGFIAGLVTGSIASGLPHRWLRNSNVQMTMGGLALTIVMVAWWVQYSLHSVMP